MRKLPDQVVADKDYKSSSAFALLWNLCRDFLPEKIMEDFDVFLDHCNMVRMKSGQGAASEFIAGEGVGTHGEYMVCVGDAKFIFQDAEMAPPSGVFGQNYSSSTHVEYQPHMYTLAWTVRRDHPSDAGGHFYIRTYGICIQAAANSLVVWRPADVHGTSLQDLDPHFSHPP
ncbi:uncharacterized protein LACBIDRAFT_308518 [Laccaria bicolor S238N-H82]|uniref:Predicted protein n=1 Tax=Laccaria bicolor (strain S238N-H82 / ATCC MYA-4686) TaxID=486041 RepID=B0CWJ3_LACBS|nr:uncharacterized protein LACBIDRAFT_308518 [Laccaria bicolor S238N-H82]EDR13077.1 predicted protein [Laccaria bicolor S238N-H82]|eukprot:XP_001875575.1 predicted protein [Laccaria bicolor S238N-H82]